jgi:hypothetical protein
MSSIKPRLSKAAVQLREQFDDTFPDRDRRSDGWIGDTRHASRPSDHNPDPKSGVVRAIDIDRDVHKNGKPDLMPDIADQIRLAAKRGEKRISYIIFNSRIASSRMGWRWRKYKGSNPHVAHCHVSFTRKGDKDGSFFQIPLLGADK